MPQMVMMIIYDGLKIQGNEHLDDLLSTVAMSLLWK